MAAKDNLITLMRFDEVICVNAKDVGNLANIRYDHMVTRMLRRGILNDSNYVITKKVSDKRSLRFLTIKGMKALTETSKDENQTKIFLSILNKMDNAKNIESLHSIGEISVKQNTPKTIVVKSDKEDICVENMTDELVELHNNELVTSSLQVAYRFDKRHFNVTHAIETLSAKLEELSDFVFIDYFYPVFTKDEYTTKDLRKATMYYMNKDAFTLLVMGFTGAKALEWKCKFARAFNMMEQKSKSEQTLINGIDITEIKKNLSVPHTLGDAYRLIADLYDKQEALMQLPPAPVVSKEDLCKLKFFDRAFASNEGLTLREAAQFLDFYSMGQNKLITYMVDKKMISDTEHIMQSYKDRDLFFTRLTKIVPASKHQKSFVVPQIFVTLKGLQFLEQKLLKDGYIQRNPEKLPFTVMADYNRLRFNRSQSFKRKLLSDVKGEEA